MRWFTSNLLIGFLGRRAPLPVEERLPPGSELNLIREKMLSLLGDQEADFPELAMRLRHGDDAIELWYCRGELMGALAALHGEAHARDLLAPLSPMFNGLLPTRALSRRPRTPA